MIYVLRMQGTNFYKIGHTKQAINNRVRGLQVGCPRKLIVITTFKGNHQLETAIHHHLTEFSTDGGREWFRLPRGYPIDQLRNIPTKTKPEKLSSTETDLSFLFTREESDPSFLFEMDNHDLSFLIISSSYPN